MRLPCPDIYTLHTIYLILPDASNLLSRFPDSRYSRPPSGRANHIATILDLVLTLSHVLDSSSFSQNYRDIADPLLQSSRRPILLYLLCYNVTIAYDLYYPRFCVSHH